MDPPSPGAPVGMSALLRRLDERGVLGAVDEPGQVEVVVVGPADHLVGQRRLSRELPDDGAREVEDDVVGGAGQPDDDVVLGGREGVAVRADERLVEPRDPGRRGIGRHGRPELRSEAGHQVDATDGRARLAQARPPWRPRQPHRPRLPGRARGTHARPSPARRCRPAVTPSASRPSLVADIRSGALARAALHTAQRTAAGPSRGATTHRWPGQVSGEGRLDQMIAGCNSDGRLDARPLAAHSGSTRALDALTVDLDGSPVRPG